MRGAAAGWYVYASCSVLNMCYFYLCSHELTFFSSQYQEMVPVCLCFIFLYLYLFSAVERVSNGKAL